MTRYVLLLLGGAIAVSAFGVTSVKSPETTVPSWTVTLEGEEVSPDTFFPNLGKMSGETFFYLRHGTKMALLKATGIDLETWLSDSEVRQGSIYFIGANKAPKVQGIQSPISEGGFVGVEYQDLYKGVNLRITSTEEGLLARFLIRPGADPSQIHFKFDRVVGTSVEQPVAWQDVDGAATDVDATFESGRYGSFLLKLGKFVEKEPMSVEFTIGL